MSTEGQAEVEQPAAEEEDVSLELKGSGISLSRSISMNTALDVMNVVLGGPRPQRATPSSRSERNGPQPSGTSVGEFLAEVEAKKNPDKMVAIGVWLEDESGQDSFTTGQVKDQFQRAKHKAPANFSRDWNKAMKARMIAQRNDAADQYYVTNTGRNAVERKFAE